MSDGLFGFNEFSHDAVSQAWFMLGDPGMDYYHNLVDAGYDSSQAISIVTEAADLGEGDQGVYVQTHIRAKEALEQN